MFHIYRCNLSALYSIKFISNAHYYSTLFSIFIFSSLSQVFILFPSIYTLSFYISTTPSIVHPPMERRINLPIKRGHNRKGWFLISQEIVNFIKRLIIFISHRFFLNSIKSGSSYLRIVIMIGLEMVLWFIINFVWHPNNVYISYLGCVWNFEYYRPKTTIF